MNTSEPKVGVMAADRPANSSPLRVALLVDSLDQPAWVARMLEEVAALPFVRIALVIRNETAGLPAQQTVRKRRRIPIRGIIANRDRLLYELYSRLDARRYTPSPNAFASVRIDSLLQGVPQMDVRPKMTKFSDFITDEDYEKIAAYELDVALRLGFRILRGKALQIARYGVWSYHHGDNARYRGGPAGFWEVMEDTPVTGAILQVLTEDLDDGHVLARRFGRTERNSVAENRDKCHWHSVPMVARKLADLHELGVDGLREHARELTPYSERLYTSPRDRHLVRPLSKMISRRIRSHARALASTEQWIVAYRFHSKARRNSAAPLSSFYNFERLIPPRDRFWADPFVVVREGRAWMFIEEFVYSSGVGHIAVLQARPDGTWSTPEPVLTRPWHLSYPFTFEWNGELFMLPESGAAGKLELHRCISFPDQWDLDIVLLENTGVYDATMLEYEGHWWLFATNTHPTSRDADEELSVFHAPTPRGPWEPHCRNPVKTDVRSARPAGRFFEWRGDLYRPAQDCSVRYGHSIVLNRVLQLDRSAYREVEIARILPHWMARLVATHTINSAPGITVIDGLLRRPRIG